MKECPVVPHPIFVVAGIYPVPVERLVIYSYVHGLLYGPGDTL